MNKLLLEKGYIPLDKSWIIRMGVLDILNGYSDIVTFLSSRAKMSSDLRALCKAASDWRLNVPIDVGESGTLYRMLRFASWKLKLDKKFLLRGTLKDRKITDNPKIVTWKQEKLLTLDCYTSQWASAAVILGDKERLKHAPYKLALTYEAVAYWKNQRAKNQTWTPRFDSTIHNQAVAYLNLRTSKDADFHPRQGEDYCFAYAFGMISPEEGEDLWPSLNDSETNRVSEMTAQLALAKAGKKVTSRDHRIVQAIAMWGKVNGQAVEFEFPEAVNRSWPQFWDFLNDESLLKA